MFYKHLLLFLGLVTLVLATKLAFPWFLVG